MILSKDKSLTPRNIKATDNLRGNILKRKISESFSGFKKKKKLFLFNYINNKYLNNNYINILINY